MMMVPTMIGPATFMWSAVPNSSASLGVMKLLRELPILGKLKQIPRII
jgi:hypothetical protein